jgi:hypothetical protein
MGSPSAQGAGIEALVCRSVCTPLDEATIQAAIDRLTVALTMAHDDEIPALVTERCALRDELSALRQVEAGVVRLDDQRARRGPKA